jgi:hypothetical protein
VRQNAAAEPAVIKASQISSIEYKFRIPESLLYYSNVTLSRRAVLDGCADSRPLETTRKSTRDVP